MAQKMMRSFYSRIDSVCRPSAPVISTPIDVATSPTLIAPILSSAFLITGLSFPPSTWLIPRYRWILLIITLIIAWFVSPCVAPASPSPELAHHMMSHLHAHPAEVTAKTHTHEMFFGYSTRPLLILVFFLILVFPHLAYRRMSTAWKPCGAIPASITVATLLPHHQP